MSIARTFLVAGIIAAVSLVRPAAAQEVVNYGVQPATMPIYIAKALGLLDPIE